MKPKASLLITAALGVFGVMTVALAGSVIFDLFDIRRHEGNYVLFVVWANLFSGVLFLAAAYGFIARKAWTALPLAVSAVILILALFGLVIHANAGGLYESKTVGAMIFRIAINLTLLVIIHHTSLLHRNGAMTQRRLLLFIPVLMLVSACTQTSDETGGHDHKVPADHHEHGGFNAELAIELDNGQKWKADENTLRQVRKMEEEVLAFGRNAEADHKVLADSLRRDLDRLVAGCTMKGKAHDKLHKWLLPHLDQVESLSNARRKAEANEIVKELEESFQVFNQSFE